MVRDPQTLKSKGYGFVSFVKKSVSSYLQAKKEDQKKKTKMNKTALFVKKYQKVKS